MNEQKLRDYIRRALMEGNDAPQEETPEQSVEPEQKPKKKKKADTAPGEIGVSAGRGRWSKEVKEAGALAEEDPEQLMANLGIEKKGTGYQGVADILKQALAGSDVMQRAYSSGLKAISQGPLTGIQISMGDLDSRNGAKYIHHTLIGARNAGMLALDIPIQVDRLDGSSVVIYKSPKKSAWPKPSPKKDEE